MKIIKVSMRLTTFCGMGKVMVMNGSKVIDYLPQSGQVTLDLYWPVIKSVTIDWFLLIWEIQLSKATMSSDRLLLSTDSTIGFYSTRFKSSWSPSTKNEKNSCESCWAYPENIGFIEATAPLMLSGENTLSVSHHIPFINFA